MAKTRDARIAGDEPQTGLTRRREAAGAAVAETTPDFTAMAVSREELAPKFMKAFGLWQAETGSTFVEFVRFLVPEIGNTRAEYRNHRAYQAADYLRRLVGNAARKPTTQAERAAAPASARCSSGRSRSAPGASARWRPCRTRCAAFRC